MNTKCLLCVAFTLGAILWRSACDAENSYPQVSAATSILKFVSTDSEETNAENGHGANAVDGDPNTIWHTEWQGNSPGLPHEIIAELSPSAVIKGFAYLPRQDESDHGTIKDYEFYVSNDGTNFGTPVSKGAFESGKGEKIETFSPIKCHFIKLRAISEINGLPWASAAEIRVIQQDEPAAVKDYWRGNIGVPASPQPVTGRDAIDSLVDAFSANGDLWLNGIDTIEPSFASVPKEVVSETFQDANFHAGMMTSYRILDIRTVSIGGLGPYTAALADTNLGQMIVIMRESSRPGQWWRRIYDAHPPYNRLY